MKKGFFLSSAGTSLIELSIAVFIGSIIITSAYRSHEYLSRSAERENKKAMIQRDLITATEKMSREIRMLDCIYLEMEYRQFSLIHQAMRFGFFQTNQKAKQS
jgi:type II secretory pathway component PulJ